VCSVPCPPPPPFSVFKGADLFDLGGRGGRLQAFFVAGAVFVSGEILFEKHTTVIQISS